MAKVNLQVFAEPSARAPAREWTPDLIRLAERRADAGDLTLATELVEELIADDKVEGALVTFVGALLGSELSFEASGDKRRGPTAVRALEAGEDWWRAFPESELTQLISYALLLGVGLAQIDWKIDPDTGRRTGTIQVWSPRHLRWDWSRRRWMLRVGDTGEEIEITPGDGKWILLTPYGRSRPWRYGRWRAIARWWVLKAYAINDWGLYSERHGAGILTAETTQTPPIVGNSGPNREKLRDDLERLGRNTPIAMPPGWSLRLVESVANTSGTFEKQIDLADRGITIAIHGTNLTNEQGGSFAKAQVLRGVHVQVLQSLAAALSTTLHDQHLVYWASFNFGAASLAPWPSWDTEPPEDLQAKAATYSTLGTALATLVNVSERVDVDTILEQFRVPLRAVPVVPPSKKKQAPSTEEPPQGEPASPKKASRTTYARPRRGVIRGQLYADRLGDQARKAGKSELGPDLATLLTIIENAEDYESIRGAIVDAYKDMDPGELTVVAERAIILAELGGRLAAIEDTKRK